MSATGEATTTDQQEFTVGRGNLKVPTIQWNEHFHTMANAGNFFSRLWHLNGKFREMVILPEEDKPLLILRESQNPRFQEVRQIGRTILTGFDQSIQILTLPDQNGQPLEELAGYREDIHEEHLYLHGDRLDHVTYMTKSQQAFDDDVRQALGEIVGILS